MINAKVTKIGCAASTRKMTNILKKETNAVWLTCNYSDDNVIRSEVYIPGRAASMCRTGKNPKFNGLCSDKETY